MFRLTEILESFHTNREKGSEFSRMLRLPHGLFKIKSFTLSLLVLPTAYIEQDPSLGEQVE